MKGSSGWARDAALLVEALILTHMVHRTLRQRGLQATRMLTLRSRRSTRSRGQPVEDIVAVATRAFSLYPARVLCLARAFVLAELLGRNGASATVCIGVKTNWPLRLHAWVEHDGVCVGDPSEGDHRLIYTYLCQITASSERKGVGASL